MIQLANKTIDRTHEKGSLVSQENCPCHGGVWKIGFNLVSFMRNKRFHRSCKIIIKFCTNCSYKNVPSYSILSECRNVTCFVKMVQAGNRNNGKIVR